MPKKIVVLLGSGCGGSMKAPGIQNTPYLEQAYEMGRTVYPEA